MGLEENRGKILQLTDEIIEILKEDASVKLRYDGTVKKVLQTLGDDIPISETLKAKHLFEVGLSLL